MTISLPLTKQSVLAVGLMSGTSMDGIDAALVRLTGSGEQTEVDLIKYETLSFSEELKQRIFDCCHPDTSKVDEICRLNVELGERFAEAVHHVVNTSGLQIEDLDFVSSHGQTLYHLPNESATLQIGELASSPTRRRHSRLAILDRATLRWEAKAHRLFLLLISYYLEVQIPIVFY